MRLQKAGDKSNTIVNNSSLPASIKSDIYKYENCENPARVSQNPIEGPITSPVFDIIAMTVPSVVPVSRFSNESAKQEINTIIRSESGIYSTGIGWTSTGDRVHGFGESEKEFRLVVGVDASVFEHYKIGFMELYGDRVVVEVSDMISVEDGLVSGLDGQIDGGLIEGGIDTGMDAGMNVLINPVNIQEALSWSAFATSGNTSGNAFNGMLFIWVIIGVGIIGSLLIFLRSRSHMTPAAQTVNGNVIAEGSMLSNKQVIDAVKNSSITPHKDLFNKIIAKIDSRS